MKRGLFCLLCVVLSMGAGNSEAVQYQIRDLGIFGDALSINNRGQIVGYSYTDSGGLYAFLWDSSTEITTGLGNSYGNSYANSINDNGQVVGYSVLQSEEDIQATLWDASNINSITTAGLGVFETGVSSYAADININGQVVGRSDTDSYQQAFSCNSTILEPIKHLQNLPNDDYSCANAINNSGLIVGRLGIDSETQRAFLQNSTEEIIDLGNGEAWGINDAGQVVGYLYTDGYQSAFLRDSNGQMIDLDTLLDTDIGNSCAYGINNKGWVVGEFDTDSDTQSAFLWDAGSMINLDTLSGYSNSRAYAINNNGWIVGSVWNADGSSRAVLWAPVPEFPSSILAAPAMLASVGFVFRRRKSNQIVLDDLC